MTTEFRAHAIRTALTAAMISASIVYLYINRDDLKALSRLGMTELGTLAICVLAFFLTTGFTFYLLVRMLSIRLSPVEWIGLTFLTNALNYLSPGRMGVVVKAAYLKRRKMPYSRFSSLLAATGFLTFLFSGLAGMSMLVVVWFYQGVFSLFLLFACVVLVVAGLLPLLLPVPLFERQGRVWSLLNTAIQGFHEIRRQRGRLASVGLTLITQYLLSAICCVVSFRSLDFEIDFPTALILAISVSIVNLVSLTPNNIGTQELVAAYFYAISGSNFSDGLLGSGLIRLVHIVLTFTIAPIFTHYLVKSENIRLSTLIRNGARKDIQRGT